MRVKIRSYVNTNMPVDTSKLTPLQEVKVALRTAIAKIDYIEKKKHQREEVIQRARIAAEEALKDEILYHIYDLLIDNSYFSTKGETCDSIVIACPRKDERILKTILEHNEFSNVKWKILPDDPDLVNSFNIPILVEFTERKLVDRSE